MRLQRNLTFSILAETFLENLKPGYFILEE